MGVVGRGGRQFRRDGGRSVRLGATWSLAGGPLGGRRREEAPETRGPSKYSSGAVLCWQREPSTWEKNTTTTSSTPPQSQTERQVNLKSSNRAKGWPLGRVAVLLQAECRNRRTADWAAGAGLQGRQGGAEAPSSGKGRLLGV